MLTRLRTRGYKPHSDLPKGMKSPAGSEDPIQNRKNCLSPLSEFYTNCTNYESEKDGTSGVCQVCSTAENSWGRTLINCTGCQVKH